MAITHATRIVLDMMRWADPQRRHLTGRRSKHTATIIHANTTQIPRSRVFVYSSAVTEGERRQGIALVLPRGKISLPSASCPRPMSTSFYVVIATWCHLPAPTLSPRRFRRSYGRRPVAFVDPPCSRGRCSSTTTATFILPPSVLRSVYPIPKTCKQLALYLHCLATTCDLRRCVGISMGRAIRLEIAGPTM
ncbi:hypothetical protein LX32DRAFT_183858 [Colletotrichum zoysiae]|uniref:Uncharacterized protein n=1 Tax=Colletotrichum zoysiae TaxID=1216348 RepID=A0AAD9H6Z5_9PEZI|nr:hypothetical protein LX32DRAFT_183858 [Colletotrichum zoysiae]